MSNDSSKNLKCPICFSSFNILTQNFECSSCKQKVCKSHLVKLKELKICENCEKSNIKSEFHPDDLQKILQLKNELMCLEKTEKKQKIEILTKNDILNKLEKQSAAQLGIHLDRVLSIKKKIDYEAEKCESDEKLARFLEQSLMECKKNEMGMLQKMNKSVQDMYRAKMELEDIMGIQKDLISKVYSLNLTLRKQIPISRLSLLSCSECKYSIKSRFYSVFEINQSSTSQGSFMSSILTNPLPQEPQKSTEVCKVCLII